MLLAFYCEPGRGSEWGLGWRFVEEFSRTVPVWVITHEDCRPALDKYLSENRTANPIQVTYVSLPRSLSWMRNSWYTLFNVHYYLWQFAAANAAKKLHARVKLDLVQHVSLCRWWMPSAGAALVKQGVGFIFGPVAGGEIMPPNFRQNTPVVSRVADAMRFIGRSIGRRDPLLRRTLKKADLLIAAIPAAEEWMRQYGNPNIAIAGTAACSGAETLAIAHAARADRAKDQPFTFTSCGGLNYARGVDIAIKAFAKANLPNARYVHVCDGPMRPSLEKLARDLGVADRVTFTGDLPHIECVKLVAAADAMVHTVLRDSEGIITDIMHAGTPVITINHLTPALLVTPECGHLLKMDASTTPQQMIDELADVMKQWVNDPALVAAKGKAAAERGKLFEAHARGEEYRAFHQRVLRSVRSAQRALKVALVATK